MREPLPPGWLILAFGDERQYAGNAGYEDVLTTTYRYDTNVPNHRRVAAGDVFLIRGPRELSGCARLEHIEQKEGTKQRQRCPTCGTSAIKARENRSPRFRCDKGHVFAEPRVEEVPITRFTAAFGASYLHARDAIPLAELRAACPNWNGQHAIQAIDLNRLEARLEALPGFLERILERRHRPQLLPDDAVEDATAPYVPGTTDTRATAQRQVKERRGQARFRRALIERYGGRCLISGCSLLDLVEAAHIRPYRGGDDHHPENGLLLRADLHTLFDLDLVGVNPETLAIHVHPAAVAAGYAHLDGHSLKVGALGPSRAALESRWFEYLFSVRSASGAPASDA